MKLSVKKPVISVIIPAYNEGARIRACLRSVKHQTISVPYTIIVADNNSTDQTIFVAREEGVEVACAKRKGYAYAAIAGIAKTHARIIAMTDADSVVPSDWLVRIHETFESHADVVAVAGPYEFYDGPRMLTMVLRAMNRINPRLLTSSLCGINMAFRRDAYEHVGGFSSEINLQADTYLGEQLKKIGRIYFDRDNTVLSSARRFQKPSQLISEVWIRIANALMLKLFSTTLYKKQKDYR